jgi:tRNA A37 threonylcarbamoyladenosine modification protein TsaB
MHKKKVDIVVVCISSPLLIGIYEDSRLIRTIESSQKSSDSLPIIFKELLKEYSIDSIIYTNTPGSFMAIKISYIFFKSLSILKIFHYME